MDDLLFKLDAFCMTRSCDICPIDQTGLCLAVYSIHEDVSKEARARLEEILNGAETDSAPIRGRV